MNQDYTPGEGCECSAYNESECGCDVDWTPREVYELRSMISDMEIRHAATMLHTQSIVDEANELREQRDRLATEVTEARAETIRTREFMDHGFKVASEEANELREECMEQARLLGMGAEREAKLIAERDLWKAEAERWREQAGDDFQVTAWKQLIEEHRNKMRGYENER
jgi:hypothetical protein